ncbi:MAG: CrcB family protein [Rhodospirillaceae bacterium]|nr:CrcB family protein [Rhodospirillaceae bacterium]
MRMMLMVAAGGALGSVARYLVAGQATALTGGAFPWGTLAVNVLGCAAMGALVELAALAWSPGPELRALLMVGLLGAFASFSIFALDVEFLVGRGAPMAGIAYIAASLIGSLGGFLGARQLVRAILAG